MLALIETALSVARSDITAMFRHVRRNAVAFSIVAVLVLTAYAAGIAALAIFAAESLGLAGALLAICAGALVLALLVFTIAKMIEAGIRARTKKRHDSDTAALLASLGVGALPIAFRSKGIAAIAAAAAIAYIGAHVSGDAPFTRRTQSSAAAPSGPRK